MIRIPVTFLAGVVGTGYMLLNDVSREVVSLHFYDDSLVPENPPYSYSVTGDGVTIEPIMVLEPPVFVLPPMGRVLTRSDFLKRITDAELAGILAAAKLSVPVEVWVKRFDVAEEVDLDDPLTVGGLYALEAGGLIAPGRAGEILNA